MYVYLDAASAVVIMQSRRCEAYVFYVHISALPVPHFHFMEMATPRDHEFIKKEIYKYTFESIQLLWRHFSQNQ